VASSRGARLRPRPRASGRESVVICSEMAARSSIQLAWTLELTRMREVRSRALASRELSVTGESTARTAESEVCVLIED
jgi:hypothetical protein